MLTKTEVEAFLRTLALAYRKPSHSPLEIELYFQEIKKTPGGGPDRGLLSRAGRRLIRDRRFLPNLSEVLDAITEQRASEAGSSARPSASSATQVWESIRYKHFQRLREEHGPMYAITENELFWLVEPEYSRLGLPIPRDLLLQEQSA